MEIERKYLLNKEVWLKSGNPTGKNIIQGYLTTDINKTIRIRVMGTLGYMTIKGKTNHISREEFEFPIPTDMAKKLIKKYSEGIVEKIRYCIPYRGKIWEVDKFLGDNEGLLLAEIELNFEDEVFELPEWIEKEVSDDIRYFNSNLSKNPYKNWKDK
jgi:adenylate cyclase